MPEAEDVTSKTKSLHEAVRQGDIALAQRHIDEGADIDEEINYESSLDVAVETGQHDMVRFLVSRGARIEHSLLSGKSHIRRARHLKHDDIANFLQEEFPRQTIRPKRAPVIIANAQGRWWVAMLLVVLGSAAMLIGGLDLFNGTYFILPGSGMIALGAYLAQTRGRALVYCASSLIAYSMFAVLAVSLLFDGVTGWWQLVLVPYLVGWLIDLVGVPFTLKGLFKGEWGGLGLTAK